MMDDARTGRDPSHSPNDGPAREDDLAESEVEADYREMARDTMREQEALDWIEGVLNVMTE